MMFRDLLYHLVHDYPGGGVALESRLQLKEKYLQNGVNPNMNCSHHVNEQVVEKLLDFIPEGNTEAAKFFARKANCVVIPVPHHNSSASDMELLDGFMNVVKELGDFSHEFQRAWADGRITRKEFERLKIEAQETMAALQMHLERIGELVQEPKRLQQVK